MWLTLFAYCSHSHSVKIFFVIGNYNVTVVVKEKVDKVIKISYNEVVFKIMLVNSSTFNMKIALHSGF